MAATLHAPQPPRTDGSSALGPVSPAPFVDPGRAEPTGAPLRLIPGGRDAVLRHRRSPAVYRRRRLVVAVLGGVLLVAALSGARALEDQITASATSAPAAAASAVGAPTATATATAAATAAATTAADAPSADTYVVQPGDTWWSIARSFQPDGDIRGLVDELAAANGGSALLVGQQVDLAGVAAP